MKKLITLIAICMMAYVLPAVAENSASPTGTGTSDVKSASEKEKMTPEQRVAKIEERIKKLEEHKAKAADNGKTQIADALQDLIDALNNLKGVIGSKDRASIKGAMERVKTARASLLKLIPANAKERCNKAGGDNVNKTQAKSNL